MIEPFKHLLQLISAGFACFVLLTSAISLGKEKIKEGIRALTHSSLFIICIVASCYLIVWSVELLRSFHLETEYYMMRTRLLGAYWFNYWIDPLVYGVMPQLFWVKRIRNSLVLRISIAFLLLFAVYLAAIIIAVSSLHHDYVPAIARLDYTIIYDWLPGLVLFGVLLALVHLARMKLGFQQR
jgi:hypothetical protein